MTNGVFMGLGGLSRLSDAKTRSISPENFSGEKGRGGMATDGLGLSANGGLGPKWKLSPAIRIEPGEVRELAAIDGPGVIQHIWMTSSPKYRFYILRIHWDGCESPSVECPLGDFFACAYNDGFAQVNSMPVCVNPANAFNCFWEMPFRRHCRITLENRHEEAMVLYYQITYALTVVPEDCACFHAQFRRVNPLPYKADYTIVDNIRGKGHYVGTYMAWGVNNNNWWGEGEIKFFLDGDDEYPTLCGTGTEDYFLGSYNFDVGGRYQEYSTPFAGMPQVIRPDGLYKAQQRFSLYRWHIMDPIRFETDLRVTIQALGWRRDFKRYLPLQDDIASVAFWYQALPAAPFPPLPDSDYLEII